MNKKILTTGVAGAVVAAICCFTPLLVSTLAAIGLSAWAGWLDWLLLPALAGFVLLAIYGAFAAARRPPASSS